MPSDSTAPDSRTPSPPYGYSRKCDYPLEQQIRIVAEFYAHKIRPSRIAYRMGIDIALIEELIAGERQPEYFEQLVRRYRRARYQQRLADSNKKSGVSRYEAQQNIEREFEQEVDV